MVLERERKMRGTPIPTVYNIYISHARGARETIKRRMYTSPEDGCIVKVNGEWLHVTEYALDSDYHVELLYEPSSRSKPIA